MGKIRQLVIITMLLLGGIPTKLAAQQADSLAFKGTIANEEYQIWIEMNFYDQNILVPDQELFGEMAGYLGAKRDPRKWFITSIQFPDKHSAMLEIINDYGSEDLKATLTLQNDGTFLLKQTEGSPLRIVVNNKWLKLPRNLLFKRSQQ